MVAICNRDTGGIEINTQIHKSDSSALRLPKEKQTSLSLYLTSTEAYKKWGAAPEAVKVLDVRTPEEYIFVGHPEMAVNIPLVFQTHCWSEEKGHFDVAPNTEFVAQATEWAKPSDVLLVMCRSGGRSAMAVDLLAKAGFEHAYNVIDGMEGDLVQDPESLYVGKRMKNGWKNSGLPWTYELDPECVRFFRERT